MIRMISDKQRGLDGAVSSQPLQINPVRAMVELNHVYGDTIRSCKH